MSVITTGTLKVPSVSGGGGSIATVGVFRTANNVSSLTARNAANSADLTLISVDNFDLVSIRSGALLVGASASAFAGSVAAGGGTVATVGVFRTANNVASLTARNAANTTDITLISADASDRVSIRSGTLLVGATGTMVTGNVGFYGTTPVAKPTGVAVTAAGIHAALVTLGLIAA